MVNDPQIQLAPYTAYFYGGYEMVQVENGDVHITHIWHDDTGQDRSWSECILNPERARHESSVRHYRLPH